MKLEGIHHITAITGDAPQNVEFYVGVLGLRLVKKTVNQDDPTVYHLFYGDDEGSPGMDLTFFEYPRAARGSAGAGMVHRIVWRVASRAAIDFWAARLKQRGTEPVPVDGGLLFSDPEGLVHQLIIDSSGDPPLHAHASDIPAELGLQGFAGARAYSDDPARSATLLRDTLGFTSEDSSVYEVRGERRGSFYSYDPPPAGAAICFQHVGHAAALLALRTFRYSRCEPRYQCARNVGADLWRAAGGRNGYDRVAIARRSSGRNAGDCPPQHRCQLWI